MLSFPYVELSVSKISSEDCAEAETEAEAEAETEAEVEVESPVDDPKRCLNIWLLTGDDNDNCEPVLRGEVLNKNDGDPGIVFDISEAESYI